MNGAKHRFALGFTCFLLICVTTIYPYLLYSKNDFVTRYREWYIATAMGTMTHQWLATAFIPEDIIEDVMLRSYLLSQKQEGVVSTWSTDETEELQAASTPRGQFFQTFSELDEDSFDAFIRKNPSYLQQGYDKIDIDKIDSGNTGIVTTQGHEVLAINAEYGIMILKVTGKDNITGLNYEGKIALCKKPERIFVGTCSNLFSYGSFVSEMTQSYDAILGINASGFEDYEGNGTGGMPYGFLKSEGEVYKSAVGGGWKIIGFDDDDLLQIGEFSDTSNLRDAVEFYPALILNGESVIAGAGTTDVQPRTAIGQTKDKTVIMLVIDGRQTHSIGCTYEECGEIMEMYGAYQASMLDGGSSSVMVYNGREITSPTTLNMTAEGRTLPDAFLVR